VLLLCAAAVATAQGQNASPESRQPTEFPVYHTTSNRIAIGRSITIAPDEEITDSVVVIGGSVRVEGRIRNELIVVGGDATLGPKSLVGGDAVVVGGRLMREPGAQLRGSVSDVTFGDWIPWRIEMPAVEFENAVRWIALTTTVFRISLLALVMAVLLLIARAPVARVAAAAAAQPARSFLAGLLTEILFLPVLVVVSIGLAITIVGIPLVFVLVPLAILAFALAMALGFTALATRIGEWIEDRVGWRGHNVFLAAALGYAVILGPALIARILGVTPGAGTPGALVLVSAAAVEFVVWTIGLGATLITGFGRWSIVPPPVPPAPSPPMQVAMNG
jgi:hypothetical protein